MLYEDWEQESSRTIDTFLEKWSKPFNPPQIEDGKVEVRVTDLAGRFNLNSVVGGGGLENHARLKRLYRALNIDPSLADRWLDWIDDDSEVTGLGLEDGDYLLYDVPYRTANQPAAHLSEVALAAGLSREEFARFRSHVTVLPPLRLGVNVNTATSSVLESLGPNFGPSEAQSLVQSEREYEDIESFTADYAALGDSAGVLAVRSDYFEISVRVERFESRVVLTTVVYRDPSSGQLSVLSRDFGQKFSMPLAEADGVSKV
jgi:general secretion pathway protein K